MPTKKKVEKTGKWSKYPNNAMLIYKQGPEKIKTNDHIYDIKN